MRDLRYHDPWHRKMAALALREAGDEDVEKSVRSLLLSLEDHDPDVVQAAKSSLEALSPRAVGFLGKCLERLPPEKPRYRDLLIELLRQRSAAGDEEARAALLSYFEREAQGADPERAQAARKALERLRR